MAPKTHVKQYFSFIFIQQKSLIDGLFLIYFQKLNFTTLCLNSYQFLGSKSRFYFSICQWKQKCHQHSIGQWIPFLTTKEHKRCIIFDILSMNEFCASFMAVFGQLSMFLCAMLPIRAKIVSKTHIE